MSERLDPAGICECASISDAFQALGSGTRPALLVARSSISGFLPSGLLLRDDVLRGIFRTRLDRVTELRVRDVMQGWERVVSERATAWCYLQKLLRGSSGPVPVTSRCSAPSRVLLRDDLLGALLLAVRRIDRARRESVA